MIDERWRRARRILAVRLDNLGDVLLATPALHGIKRSLPQAELTLLTSPVGAQAGWLNPDLDGVIVHRSPQMDPWEQLPQDSGREQRLIATIQERRFDGAIIFTSFRQSSLPAAYVCYLADIPLRLAASIDGPGSLLTTRHRHPERLLHEVERGLDLIGAIGLGTDEQDLVLAVPDSARDQLQPVLAAVRPDPRRPLVVVHPGCSMPARTYPWDLYSEVVTRLVERLDATVVLTGVEEERELVERIVARVSPAARPAVHSLVGTLPFPMFCALIEAADLTVTNNTGPMHVAAAVKTPVVALFALTNPPEQWSPWRVPHRRLSHDVACRLCYHRTCPYGHECLRLVTPPMVIDAAADLLAAGGGPAVDGGGRRQAPAAGAVDSSVWMEAR